MTTPSRSDTPSQSHITLLPSKLELNLEPLTYDRYWRFGLLPSKQDYAFCSHMGTAPLKTSEFKRAKNNFPIVFFDTDGHIAPHAILGLSPHINLALTHKNAWRKELYLPKEFQFYPFGIMDIENKDRLEFADSLSIPEEGAAASQQKSILGIVPQNPMLVPLQGESYAHQLFQQDGSITPYVAQILQQHATLKQEQLDTASFVSAIRANNLLVKRSIGLNFRDGTRLTLDGFSTISNTAFNKTSSTTIERWKSQGYLERIEQHLASQNKWAPLITLHERRLKRALRALHLKK